MPYRNHPTPHRDVRFASASPCAPLSVRPRTDTSTAPAVDAATGKAFNGLNGLGFPWPPCTVGLAARAVAPRRFAAPAIRLRRVALSSRSVSDLRSLSANASHPRHALRACRGTRARSTAQPDCRRRSAAAARRGFAPHRPGPAGAGRRRATAPPSAGREAASGLRAARPSPRFAAPRSAPSGALTCAHIRVRRVMSLLTSRRVHTRRPPHVPAIMFRDLGPGRVAMYIARTQRWPSQSV